MPVPSCPVEPEQEGGPGSWEREVVSLVAEDYMGTPQAAEAGGRPAAVSVVVAAVAGAGAEGRTARPREAGARPGAAAAAAG